MDAVGDLDDQVAAVLVRLELLDDAVDAADGEDLVAGGDRAEHPLLRLRLRALRADHDEPEHAEQHNDDQDSLHRSSWEPPASRESACARNSSNVPRQIASRAPAVSR